MRTAYIVSADTRYGSPNLQPQHRTPKMSPFRLPGLTNMTVRERDTETGPSVKVKNLFQKPLQHDELTRLHNLAAQGQLGHCRNLTTELNFKDQLN